MTRKTATRNANTTVTSVQQQHQQLVSANVKIVDNRTGILAHINNVQPVGLDAQVSKTNTQRTQKGPMHATQGQNGVNNSPQNQAPKPSATGVRKPLGPGYETCMAPALIQESQTLLHGQSEFHAPHRMPTKASLKPMNKQGSVENTSTPATASSKKGAATLMKKGKTVARFNNAAGKQLILRPRMEMVVYRPLVRQLQEWVVQLQQEREKRGRTAAKRTVAQKKQQQRERTFQQRNGPLLNKASSKIENTPSGSMHVAKVGNPTKSNSAPIDWSINVWEDFYEPKQSRLIEASNPVITTHASVKPKFPATSHGKKSQETPSLIPSIPPPQQAKSPAIFEFLSPNTHANQGTSQYERSRSTSKPATRISLSGQNATPLAASEKMSDAWVVFGDKPDIALINTIKPMSHYAEQRRKVQKDGARMKQEIPHEALRPYSESLTSKKQPSSESRHHFNMSEGWLSYQNIAITSGVVAMAAVGLFKILS